MMTTKPTHLKDTSNPAQAMLLPKDIYGHPEFSNFITSKK
jgi:hypothetical protein